MSATRIHRQRLSPRKLPRQRRAEETVEAILEGAAQVFERYGYAAGTTNRIAQRAGVSIGSVYQYFPNKDAILVALVRRHLAQGSTVLGPHMDRLRAGAPIEQVIEGVVEALVALHADAPRLHRVLFEETPLPSEVRAELDAMEDVLVDMLAEAIEQAENRRPTDASIAARIVVNSIEGLTHRLVLRKPDGVNTSALAREITALVCAYLFVPDAGESCTCQTLFAKPTSARR